MPTARRTCRTGWRSCAATNQSGRCGARAISAPISAAGDAVTLVASTESWDVDRGADAADAAQRRSRAAPRCSPSRTAACTIGFARELVLAADQFIITPAGRAEEAARARAAGDEVRTVIAGYHWFTDWGRDTMISLEGLTLSTRPLPRGRLHPAHVRPLRARRPDPEHVPGRREARACITPPTRRSGSSTRSIGTSRVTGDRDTLRTLLPTLRRHRRASPARARGSASASIRPTACCGRARRAISSPGWMRRSTTGW